MFDKVTVEIQTSKSLMDTWKCFTSPEYIVKWNFASIDWCCPIATNNLIVNGLFNYRMESTDGKLGFNFTGKYTKIVLYKEIDYELADSRTVKIEFIQHISNVIVRETFDAEKHNTVEHQQSGWQSILDNFKSVLEQME